VKSSIPRMPSSANLPNPMQPPVYCRFEGHIPMNVFPQNFDLLASGEDQIRQLSKTAIEASEDLTLHATIICASRL
jgi:hypothetical protein